jgi:HD-like signal output (HDOD) protein
MPFTEELDSLLKKGKDLPTLPDIVLELRAALDDDMTSDRTIADIINRDPVITGKLLRLANSAVYSRGAEVSSVLGAVQRVGLLDVRGICVVLSVVDSFSNHDSGLDVQQFWDHSAAVGRVAQLLCRRVGLSGAVSPADRYVAGLLHDVGILLLDQFFPDQLKQNLGARSESDSPLWQVERRMIQMDHGKWVAYFWHAGHCPRLSATV